MTAEHRRRPSQHSWLTCMVDPPTPKVDLRPHRLHTDGVERNQTCGVPKIQGQPPGSGAFISLECS